MQHYKRLILWASTLSKEPVGSKVFAFFVDKNTKTLERTGSLGNVEAQRIIICNVALPTFYIGFCLKCKCTLSHEFISCCVLKFYFTTKKCISLLPKLSNARKDQFTSWFVLFLRFKVNTYTCFFLGFINTRQQ